MLQIDMEDVYAVLGLCLPYLVAIGVALVALVVALVAVRGLPGPKRFLARSQAAIACVLVVAVSLNLLCLGPMATLIGLATSPALTVSEAELMYLRDLYGTFFLNRALRWHKDDYWYRMHILATRATLCALDSVRGTPIVPRSAPVVTER